MANGTCCLCVSCVSVSDKLPRGKDWKTTARLVTKKAGMYQLYRAFLDLQKHCLDTDLRQGRVRGMEPQVLARRVCVESPGGRHSAWDRFDRAQGLLSQMNLCWQQKYKHKAVARRGCIRLLAEDLLQVNKHLVGCNEETWDKASSETPCVERWRAREGSEVAPRELSRQARCVSGGTRSPEDRAGSARPQPLPARHRGLGGRAAGSAG